MVYIAIKGGGGGGGGGTPFCALVWAMHAESGVPKQRRCLQRTVESTEGVSHNLSTG